MSFEQAMKRPRLHHTLPASEQWEIDRALGILDWEGDPTPEQAREYWESHVRNAEELKELK